MNKSYWMILVLSLTTLNNVTFCMDFEDNGNIGNPPQHSDKQGLTEEQKQFINAWHVKPGERDLKLNHHYLMDACTVNNLKKVEACIQEGANVNLIVNGEYRYRCVPNPPHYTVCPLTTTTSPEIVKCLLAARADIYLKYKYLNSHPRIKKSSLLPTPYDFWMASENEEIKAIITRELE